jgi:hypothetical protein
VPTTSIIRVIALFMEAESASETSVNFYQTTRHNVLDDRNLHTCHRENQKSHKKVVTLSYYALYEKTTEQANHMDLVDLGTVE